MKSIVILGTRGVPATHGGFETFAEHLSLNLARQAWDVTVYCQADANVERHEDDWNGVRRIHIPVRSSGPLGTIVFDWLSTVDAVRRRSVCLTLGYNTAVFTSILRLGGRPNIINMDGIEWKRAKWGRLAKLWFWLNERVGCWLGTHLIADHPEIKRHLETRVDGNKITVIPYGAPKVDGANVEVLERYGLTPGGYLTLIARAEPENSVLEAVSGFSRRQRGLKLVVLGAYSKDHPYQRSVMEAAGQEVVFTGPIYEKPIVEALRYHSLGYVHGHQVGGTNPSLVEALGAGNAVLAHNNGFNRWVAGDSALYFSNADEFADALDALVADQHLLKRLRAKATERFEEEFRWPDVLDKYTTLLSRYCQ